MEGDFKRAAELRELEKEAERAHMRHAVAVVEEAIKHEPYLGGVVRPVVLFALAVRGWVEAAEHVATLEHADEAGLWTHVFKPWLFYLVGWDAQTDWGRWAGSSGYTALAEHWNDVWTVRRRKREGGQE